MFKKLKPKFKPKFGKKAFIVVATLVTVCAGFLMPLAAVYARDVSEGANCSGDRNSSADKYGQNGTSFDGARVCNTTSFKLTTNLKVNGQNSNFVNVGPNDSISIDVTIVLNSPPDLRMSDDSNDKGKPGNSVDFVYFDSTWSANPAVAGFGATVTAQDTSNFCGSVGTLGNHYFKCDSNGTVGSGSGVSSNTFTDGKGPYDQYQLNPTMVTVNAGGTVYHGTYSISSSDFDRLGIKNIKSAASSNSADGLNEIYVYPDLVMNFTSSADDWTTLQPAAPIFVRRYSSDAVKTADAANTPPACTGSSDFGKTGAVTCVPANATTQTSSGVGTTGAGTSILSLVAQVISGLVFLLQELIFYIFSYLILPFLIALLSIHTYTDVFAGVVYPGWVIVRNACNILFIVSIIAIGLGTLFRVESYQYKHLLVQLIIAALLVNFSLVIGQAVLGLADTIQNQFLPNSSAVVKSLGNLMIVNNISSEQLGQSFQNTGSSFANVIVPLFSLAFSIGTFVVFCALVAFLAIRVIMLWMFLMISPIAYVAGVLPTTAHYRAEWWKNFIKYAFFTPIIAFFLNIAATLSLAQTSNPVLQQLSSLVQADPSMNQYPNITTFVFKIGGNIMLLIFLFAAIEVANRMGVYGGSAVAEIGKKGLLAPFTATGGAISALSRKGAGYAGYRYNQWTSNMVHGRQIGWGKRLLVTALNPVQTYKGWQKHAEEQKHSAKSEAEAIGLMIAEQTLSPGKAFNRKALAERAHDAEFLKNYNELTREEAIDTAFDVSTMKKDINGRAAARAIIEANQKEGWIDDIVQEAREDGRGKELIAAMKALKSKYKITDTDFETTQEVEYETEINPVNGKTTYKRDADGRKIARRDAAGNIVYKKNTDGTIKTSRHLRYDVKTRRAMYLAMFGEDVHTEKDENGVEREVVSFKDQAAAKMIADIGEVNGKATKHAEYMSDNVYDAKAAHGTGGYSFYDLEYANEVFDEQLGHNVAVGADGRAVEGMYKNQLITKSHAGAVHARKEVAKWGSREQAGIAPHALMDYSNGKLQKDMFQVVAKAMSENPGFAQERTANMLLTGTDNPSELRSIIEHYNNTGELLVNEQAYSRIKDMREVSPEALSSVIARFINKGDKPGAADVRIGKAAGGTATAPAPLKVTFKDQSGATQHINLAF